MLASFPSCSTKVPSKRVIRIAVWMELAVVWSGVPSVGMAPGVLGSEAVLEEAPCVTTSRGVGSCEPIAGLGASAQPFSLNGFILSRVGRQDNDRTITLRQLGVE